MSEELSSGRIGPERTKKPKKSCTHRTDEVCCAMQRQEQQNTPYKIATCVGQYSCFFRTKTAVTRPAELQTERSTCTPVRSKYLKSYFVLSGGRFKRPSLSDRPVIRKFFRMNFFKCTLVYLSLTNSNYCFVHKKILGVHHWYHLYYSYINRNKTYYIVPVRVLQHQKKKNYHVVGL